MLALILIFFFKLFFILVANEETWAQRSLGQLLAPCQLCTHQDVLAVPFRFSPAAEVFGRNPVKNECLDAG